MYSAINQARIFLPEIDCLKHQHLATARAKNGGKIELWLDLIWLFLYRISDESTHQTLQDSTNEQDVVNVLGKA